MNHLTRFISGLNNIENVVLIAGKYFDENIVKELCKESNVKNIRAYIESPKSIRAIKRELADTKAAKKVNIEFYKLDEIKNLESLDKNSVLAFEGKLKFDDVASLSRLKPDVLCGSMEFAAMTSFEMWEEFKSCTKHIHILTYGSDRHNEVLDWKKNEKSDIELSVIFPMYNIAKYLPQCIESVTAWKADYVEYLFVDDGSPDNCAEIVEEAAKKDSRIKLLRKENGGCASARQYGLENAKGKYIGFIDPDDYIDESMFRKLLRRAFMGGYEISYSGYKELYEDLGTTKDVDDLVGMPYMLGTNNRNLILELVPHLRCAIWRGIYLKDMIDLNGIHFYTDLRRFDDLPFKVETLAVAKSVVSIPEHLYFYRMSRPGQDVAANDERLYVHFPIFKHLDEFTERIFSKRAGSKEFIEKLQIVKLQTHIYAIKKLLPEYISEYVKQAKKDLLQNMSFANSLLLYKSSVGKQEIAFYISIVKGNGETTKALCEKLKKREDSRNMRKNNVRTDLEKLRNIGLARK